MKYNLHIDYQYLVPNDDSNSYVITFSTFTKAEDEVNEWYIIEIISYLIFLIISIGLAVKIYCKKKARLNKNKEMLLEIFTIN